MGCMRRMPRISVGSIASVAHPAWRKIKNIDSGAFRKLTEWPGRDVLSDETHLTGAKSSLWKKRAR